MGLVKALEVGDHFKYSYLNRIFKVVKIHNDGRMDVEVVCGDDIGLKYNNQIILTDYTLVRYLDSPLYKVLTKDVK